MKLEQLAELLLPTPDETGLQHFNENLFIELTRASIVVVFCFQLYHYTKGRILKSKNASVLVDITLLDTSIKSLYKISIYSVCSRNVLYGILLTIHFPSLLAGGAYFGVYMPMSNSRLS